MPPGLPKSAICLASQLARNRCTVKCAGTQREQRQAPEGGSHGAQSPASTEVVAEEGRGVSGRKDVEAPVDGVASKPPPSAKPPGKRRQSQPVRHADEEVRGPER